LEKKDTGSAAKWLPAQGVNFWLVDGQKAGKNFVFNSGRDSSQADRGLPETFKALYSGKLPL
jgi:hypothetical protein